MPNQTVENKSIKTNATKAGTTKYHKTVSTLSDRQNNNNEASKGSNQSKLPGQQKNGCVGLFM
jgi:hypothetical protein